PGGIGRVYDSRARPAGRVVDVARRQVAPRCNRGDVRPEPAETLRNAVRSVHADDHGGAGHGPRALSWVPPGAPCDGGYRAQLAVLRRTAPRVGLLIRGRTHGLRTGQLPAPGPRL